MLFRLRYKKARVGVTEGLLELPDTATVGDAEKIGRQLCLDEPGMLFLSVDYAILNKRPKPVDATHADTRKAS